MALANMIDKYAVNQLRVNKRELYYSLLNQGF